MKNILLINPWIYDFAAYNMWFRPMGLLYIGGFVKKAGYNIALIDCLESNHKKKKYGDGNFHKEEIERPAAVKDIPRKYSRYGMPLDDFMAQLDNAPKPDAVLVTSIMTYWYPGALKVIDIIKDKFKDVPILMGGIYVTLNWEHATSMFGSDVFLIKGEGEHAVLNKLNELLGAKSTDINVELNNYDNYPYPLLDLYKEKNYCGMLTSRGCPFNCSYCASQKLHPGFKPRSPLNVADEIDHHVNKQGFKNIAFFDDALLYDPHEHIIPILDQVIQRKIKCNFHLPNGIFARLVDKEIAEKMFYTGFKTIRLGFESADTARQKESSSKVNNQDIKMALQHLYQAGYTKNEVGIYILMGLPHQTVEEVVETLMYVHQIGGRPFLANYAIIPDTPYYQDAKKELNIAGEMDPLLHNNSIYPLWREKYGWEIIDQVKKLAQLVAQATDHSPDLLDQTIMGLSVRKVLKKLTGM